ncbi:hypothetical protein A3758_07270 [Oleiphilus sp. HI0118]|nr:hypothetical protein A3758_07270 [Oleiphilus sp. HI0118]KZZ81664.1 hypothetical protein A3767_06885 [Oleiphilus sp. HI0133]
MGLSTYSSAHTFLRLVLLLSISFALTPALASDALPTEIKKGMLEYHLDREDYFTVLTMLQADDRDTNPLHVALAEQHLGLAQSYPLKTLEQHIKTLNERDRSRLRLASLLYRQGDCKNALKHLKGKAQDLNGALQNQRAYLRGQCFIELGNHNFAAQSLSRALEGEWAASAYYNLATDYAATSRNPRRALLSLKVARDINLGEGLSEVELTNRINLSAGALYLDNGKPEMANEFFNQIEMDSIYVTQALYLSGLAKNELQDYRGAIQSWQASLQFGLSAPGVAESLIAIPHAQALSGFQTQALESYIKASKQFLDEQQNVDSLISAIEEYGAIDVLLEERPKADLQWFLDRSTSSNTQRAIYLRYLAQDSQLMSLMKEYAQIKSLDQKLQATESQMSSLTKTLRTQIRVIDSPQSKQNLKVLEQKVAQLHQRIEGIESGLSGANLAKTRELVTSIEERLSSAREKATTRKSDITGQLKDISRALGRISASRKALKAFNRTLDTLLSDVSEKRLSSLKNDFSAYYEQAELGLVQILEAQARLRTKRTNLLDARYQ